MPQTCPRCRRANPNEAVFCFFDGVVLDSRAGSGQWSRPLVLPGGQSCRTLEDLANGLRQDWDAARHLLESGHLAQFFRDNNRHDLASLADDAARIDPDLGLYQFLGQLPQPTGPQPRLEVSPRRLVLGPYPAGGQHQTSLRLTNRGSGRLRGTLKFADDVPWLRLGDRPDAARIDAEASQNFAIQIDTRGLTSGQTYSTKLMAITSGGLAEIPVAVEITASPFPTAPFKGATTQRRLAELMRSHPKDAVAAIERGDVARWFASNGWAYPVSGPRAEGVGCVQQLFECMGLTKPPHLELSPAVVDLVSERGRPVGGSVVLRAASKKWVYAVVESSSPWLRVRTPSVSGPQQATIEFEADPSRMPDGASTAEGEVELVANAGIRLRVKVRLESRKPAARKVASKAGAGDWTRALLAGALALLIYRVLAIVPADLIGRLFGSGPPTPGSVASWLTTPGTVDGFLRRFVMATWWLGGLVGLVLAWKRDGKILDLLAGLVAGSAAGLAAMATLGCVLIPGDELPRRLLGLVVARDSTLPAVVATLAWLILACGCWAVAGAAVGVLCLVFGATGRKVLGWLTAPMRWASVRLGMRELAEMFRFG